jgi:NADH-quinone oxidoreductase subunit M
MGFVMLGIFVFNMQGMQGAVYQMLAHGVITGALFLLVGVIYERTHDRQIAHLGGLNARTPHYAGIFGLFVFASIGLPGLAGFIGEFLVLLGTFRFNGYVAGITMFIVIASAVYMLWMYQRMFFTVPSDWMKRFWPSLKDLSRNEWLALAPLILLVVAMGVYPVLILDAVNNPAQRILDAINGAGGLTSLQLPW